MRVAVLWLIAALAALDLAGAAYLRELWNERHPELSDSVRPPTGLLNGSERQRALPGSRIPSTR
jgi:hypothetical protein